MTADMRPPHEVQAPLFKRLGDELVELTPEHWRDIALSMSQVTQPQAAPPEWRCTISSPEGFTEKVEPSQALVSIVRDLADTFAAHGARFQSADCRVRQELPDSWRVVVDYHY